MTAEIAILNKSAVALAADSAMTFGAPGSEKIYDTASKLFTLSKYHPVGVMIYNNTEFLGVPWETIIKTYRAQLGERSYKTIRGYTNDFLKYLRDPRWCTHHAEQSSIINICASLFRDIRQQILRDINESKPNPSNREIDAIVTSAIEGRLARLRKAKTLPFAKKISAPKLLKKYQKDLRQLRGAAFDGIDLTRTQERKLQTCVRQAIIKNDLTEWSSGLVIAGFGSHEIFPTLIQLEVDGALDKQPKIDERSYEDIGRQSTSTVVIPLAQDEMVHRFMSGIDFEYQRYLHIYVRNLLYRYGTEIINLHVRGNKAKKGAIIKGLRDTIRESMKKLEEDAREFRRERFVDPIIEVVEHLPKDELANMAEALVNLTSIKRRVSAEKETVGGAIDVAVISKGDGFIWIKRKHYFEPELNPHFTSSYLTHMT